MRPHAPHACTPMRHHAPPSAPCAPLCPHAPHAPPCPPCDSHIGCLALAPLQQGLWGEVGQRPAAHGAHVGHSILHLEGKAEISDLGGHAARLALTATQEHVGRLQSEGGSVGEDQSQGRIEPPARLVVAAAEERVGCLKVRREVSSVWGGARGSAQAANSCVPLP